MMRLHALSLMVPLWLTGQVVPPEPAVEKVVLADGVYLFRTPFDGFVYGNSVAIVNDDDVVVFDTNARPSAAAAVLAEIRKVTDKPVHFVINSHWHNDHWTGNSVYAKAYPGLVIMATEETAAIMHNMAPARAKVAAQTLARDRAALAAAVQSGQLSETDRAQRQHAIDEEATLAAEETVPRVFPNLTFADRLTFHRGHRELRLFRVDGHATGETALYLPNEKVLLAGDILVYPIPYQTTNYRIRPWIKTLDQLDALDATVIVPGHGPAFRDKQYLHVVRNLFASIVQQVDAALAAGLVSVDDVRGAVHLDTFKTQFAHGDPALERDFDAMQATLVKKAYQEALDGMEGRS